MLKERQKKDISDRKTKKKTSALLDDLKRTKVYWKLNEEELVRTLLRARSGRGYGPVERQTRN